MNTIPITLDEFKPTYTVLGGVISKNNTNPPPLSVLILNRGPMLYRVNLVQELLKAGFSSIVSIECGDVSPELESIVGRFPSLRFICLPSNVDIGTRINIGIRESLSPYVLVMWNDMKLSTSTLSERFLRNVAELDKICLTPDLSSIGNDNITFMSCPKKEIKNKKRNKFSVVFGLPSCDHEATLFPPDYCGIYSKEKFIFFNGFDWTITNPYWQKLDFGLRSWLWGEKILYSQSLRLTYQSNIKPEDTTPDKSYGRFYLKNLCPVYNQDCATLPKSKFIPFLFRSGYNLGIALKEWKIATEWIEKCSFRFKTDAVSLSKNWDVFAGEKNK